VARVIYGNGISRLTIFAVDVDDSRFPDRSATLPSSDETRARRVRVAFDARSEDDTYNEPYIAVSPLYLRERFMDGA
jgi:hypothetical protein